MAKSQQAAPRSTRTSAPSASASRPTAPARQASQPPPSRLPPRNPPPVVKATRIKVRATMTGYYDHARRHEGDVFDIDGATDEKGNVIAFSNRWMERVGVGAKMHTTTAQQAIDRKHDEILGGNASRPTGDDDPLGAGGDGE